MNMSIYPHISVIGDINLPCPLNPLFLRWSTSRGVCASGWLWHTVARHPIRSWGWWWWLTHSRRPQSTRCASTVKCSSRESTWTSRSSTARTGRAPTKNGLFDAKFWCNVFIKIRARSEISPSRLIDLFEVWSVKHKTQFHRLFLRSCFIASVQGKRSCFSCRSFLFMRKSDPILPGLAVKYVADGSGPFPLSR